MEDKQNMIREQASEWFVLMSSGEVDTADRNRFQQWIAVDPAHERAYQRIEKTAVYLKEAGELVGDKDKKDEKDKREAIDAAFNDITLALSATTAEQSPPSSKVSTRLLNIVTAKAANKRTFKPFAAAASVLIGVMLIALWQIIGPHESSPTRYQTLAGEIRNITLEDGSAVTLGPLSQLDVTFNRNARSTRLISGEAFFAVAKEMDRAFTVDSGQTQIRVLGTAFNVNRNSQEVTVAVAEGVVEVSHQQQNSAADDVVVEKVVIDKVVIKKGQAVTASKRKPLPQPRTIAADQAGNWRSGRLVFNDVALWKVVEDINRFYKGRIVIVSPSIRELRVTAAFQVDQIKSMLFNLTVGLPIKAIEDNNTILLMADTKGNTEDNINGTP